MTLLNEEELKETTEIETNSIKEYKDDYSGAIQFLESPISENFLKDIKDLNTMFPEVTGGFIKVEPKKELDEKRDSDTTIKKVGGETKE